MSEDPSRGAAHPGEALERLTGAGDDVPHVFAYAGVAAGSGGASEAPAPGDEPEDEP